MNVCVYCDRLIMTIMMVNGEWWWWRRDGDGVCRFNDKHMVLIIFHECEMSKWLCFHCAVKRQHIEGQFLEWTAAGRKSYFDLDDWWRPRKWSRERQATVDWLSNLWLPAAIFAFEWRDVTSPFTASVIQPGCQPIEMHRIDRNRRIDLNSSINYDRIWF